MDKTWFKAFIVLAALCIASNTFAEEKSMWQKFVDFFSPTPTVEGEGPEYDELRKLDEKISKTEGQYSRERRPNKKAIIKKDLEALKEQREALAKKIENSPKSSSSQKETSTATSNCKQDTIFVRDSIFVRDTVFVKDTVTLHDTLYVIVADKKKEEPVADSTQVQADSSSQAAPNQPGIK